jgi:hypothetical protein
MVWRRPEFRADNVGFGSECGELCGGILVHGGGRQFVGGAPLKKAGLPRRSQRLVGMRLK